MTRREAVSIVLAGVGSLLSRCSRMTHPDTNAAPTTVWMPQVKLVPNLDEVFDQARRISNGESGGDGRGRNVTVVTPLRICVSLPCPLDGTMPDEDVANVEQLIGRVPSRNIAVIALNDIRSTEEAVDYVLNRIPFFGFLLGFAYIGHTVWVFEGHESALEAGCKHADVLIVDSGMIPFLRPDWSAVASAAMRTPTIWVHDRETYSLQVLREPTPS